MCGIAGIYADEVKDIHAAIAKMTTTIAHRGPDAEGHWVKENVALGHRRLSIIDLSSGANQPMVSHCGRYVMAYNGEIYNFQEIAKEIEQYNTAFNGWKTSSDTEVILEAFVLWGHSFVHKLNGMFSIAIYDTIEKKIHLFRDRLGVKPVFYFLKDDFFAFASELKAITAVDETKKMLTLNKRAVAKFLHLGYVPQPETIYTHIYKFPSGSYGVYDGHSLQIEKYWSIADKVGSTLITDKDSALSELKSLVESSVKYRMISDVPFGTFLSGGIDSSLVTAVAQSVSSNPIKTFSIGFEDSKFNESKYAAKIADYLNTNHTEMIISQKEGLEIIPRMMDIYDEPYADSSAIPTMMVSMMAKKHVTMTLSGDGGDELFFGYGAYHWAKRMHNPLIRFFHKPLAMALKSGDNRMKRASEVFNYSDYSNIKSHIFSQEQYYFSSGELDDLLNTGFELDWHEKKYTDCARKLSPIEKQSIFDMEHYLKDDLLVKVDRASMQYALETRVPLLDYRIVEFALNLAPELKIKNGVSKYLLKELLYQYVPKEFFDRPKWGFSIPLSSWLKTDLKPMFDYYTSKEVIEKYGVLNYHAVDILKKRYAQGEDYLYNRLWLIIVLNMWCEKNLSES